MRYISKEIDNGLPEGYPKVAEGVFTGKDLLVDEGVYLIDRNGRVVVSTTSNKRWAKKEMSEPARKWEEGFLRAKYLGRKDDFLTYANQIRLATREEIEKTERWVEKHPNAYLVDRNGQMRLC